MRSRRTQKSAITTNLTLPTPITKLRLRDREFLIKRDDLAHDELSGNKFRKLQKLIDTPRERYDTIISYGGTQSNAMLAIAYLAKSKGWRFRYYTKSLSKRLREKPSGNLERALLLNMELVEVAHASYETTIRSLFVGFDDRTRLVAQGGADGIARYGIEKLADELRMQLPLDEVVLVTPSGTGTTAYYLAQSLDCDIYTSAVVGDSAYLRAQMRSLGDIAENLHILDGVPYRFAMPHSDLLAIYRELSDAGVTFDLLYAPVTWLRLLEHLKRFQEKRIVYIHSGGVSGNASMLERYRYKGLID